MLSLWLSFHHKMEVKVFYVAQSGYQLPTFIKQFPETALATLVSSSTPFFP